MNEFDDYTMNANGAGAGAGIDANDPGALRSLLQAKATELFKLCDVEEKGFMNKKDILRMKDALGLSPDLLEEVFDSLDEDGNGYLTLNEFINGFSNFLGSQADHNDDSSSEVIHSNEDQAEEDAAFKETMDLLGASDLFDNDSNIKALWSRLRHEDPSMQRTFESFISNVSHEIRRSKTDFSMLESALQNKSSSHDEHVKKLYEEMEAQMKAEKARILAQEKKKERELRDYLDQDLKEKEKQLQDSLARQTELEQKLFKLNMLEYQQKQENDRLAKEKAMLEEQLQQKVKDLQDSKSYISSLEQQTKEEKRNRAKQALKVTENIVKERESLVKELTVLKDINKKLTDERDELQLQTITPTSNKEFHRQLTKQGSILSNYLRPNSLDIEMDDLTYNPVQLVRADAIVVEDDFEAISSIEPALSTTNAGTNPRDPPSMTREQPVGAISNSQFFDNVPPGATPQRVFKVVFIGDSGVGKTSFVQRFCNNSFKDSFSTTIGVDFQVKSLMIDNRVIAMQLWDTAGQERYRSITKQYFRKADCVICMYDVTSEQSFKNLRNWISSMKESASDDCLLVIIGNKIDLCENDDSRVVKYKDGAVLADTHGTLFFETSSKLCRNVFDTMESIARILQEKEDKQIEDVLNLREKEKKKACC